MFGRATRGLFERLPQLTELSADLARKALSILYIDSVTQSIEAERIGGTTDDSAKYLRRLANALEVELLSMNMETELARATAFVAAESLFLLQRLLVAGNEVYTSRWQNPKNAILIECALLYLTAGFDANASHAASQIRSTYNVEAEDFEKRHSELALDVLLDLCQLRIQENTIERRIPEITAFHVAAAPSKAARAAVFRTISLSTVNYFRWLTLAREIDLQEILATIRIAATTLSEQSSGRYADLYHLLSILELAIRETSARSLRVVPVPPDFPEDAFRQYLRSRAVTTAKRTSRLLLWPTHLEYVTKCLPGPQRHAVVSIPTGSGKSFIAELAVSHGVGSGWALYLVPTNALASQVKADLEEAFESLDHVEVKAFLGPDEYTYTPLDERIISDVPPGTVAIMTPEKCALALRLAPTVFQTCRVCVFDEFHLVEDGTRGALAELVIAHLISVSPDCAFLLMSALMANPGEIAHWLVETTNRETETIHLSWRPTRTMRAVVAADKDQQATAKAAALAALRRLPPERKTVSFEIEHALLANLQGAWTSTAADEYAVLKLPTKTKVRIDRRGNIDGWLNDTAAAVTEQIANGGFSVLTFVPRNKHHAFAVAQRLEINDLQNRVRPRDADVLAYLDIAEDELGGVSELRALLDRGVAVHSSGLIEPERKASENAFRRSQSVVMVATGTLAQGLNLPAHAVVMAGTQIGDTRNLDPAEALRRSKQQILNALGRAGRPGHTNHGLGIVVADNPIGIAVPANAEEIRQRTGVMVEEEDSTVLEGRLTTFVENVLSGVIDYRTAAPEEVTALTYLPVEQNENLSSASILSKTIAMHRRSPDRRIEESEQAALILSDLGTRFLQENRAPLWLPSVSYRTGISFFLCLRFMQALRGVPVVEALDQPVTVLDWTQWLVSILRRLPPKRARELLVKDFKAPPLKIIWNDELLNDDPEWVPPNDWNLAWDSIETALISYMQGESLITVAAALQLCDVDSSDFTRSSGAKPIPRVIEFVNRSLDKIAQLAAVPVAMSQILAANELYAEDLALLPTAQAAAGRVLALLPLSIKHGCSDHHSLAWFRFGVRLRRGSRLLANVFPVPDGLTEESGISRWIQDQLRTFREIRPEAPEDLSVDEQALWTALRTIITSI